MTTKISFKDLYQREKDKPTPVQSFIERVAIVTKKSPNTVRQWATGQQAPDARVRERIAEEFDVDPDSLFPNT